MSRRQPLSEGGESAAFLTTTKREIELNRIVKAKTVTGCTIPIVLLNSPARLPVDDKLEGIRHCIANGHDEDAQNHIFDLLRGLRCKGYADAELTREGLALKALWKPHG